MSCFIVDRKTLSRFIQWFECELAGSEHGRWERIFYGNQKQVNPAIDVDRLAADMFALNVDAYAGRYADHPRSTARARGLTFKRVPVEISLVVAYKALWCWLYQCAEDGAVDQELYTQMGRVSDYMAHTLVRGLPEFERAPYDG